MRSRPGTSGPSSATSSRATSSSTAPAPWACSRQGPAWLMGAGRVIVVDHLDYRLQKAREFAHAETVSFTEHADVVRHLKHLTDGLGADVVIDAVGAEADGNLLQHVSSAKLKLQGGSPVALNWAIDTVRKGGTVSVIGAYGPLF